MQRDGRRALSWLRDAADQGYARAEYYVGLMYEDGRGVPQDPAEALLWFRRAAAQGHADAQRRLDGPQ